MRIALSRDNGMSPVVLVLLAGIFWSFSGVLIKEIHWNPFAIAGVRSLIGGLIQFGFLAMIIPTLNPEKKDLYAIPNLLRRVYLSKSKIQWLGALSDVSSMITLTFAFQLTKAANAVFLHYSGLVLVALVSASLLNQHLKKSDWQSIGIAFLGIAFLAKDGFDGQSMVGTCLGLMCCIFFAITQTCIGLRAKETSSDFGAMETILLSNTLSFLIAIPFIAVSVFDAALPPVPEWFYLLALGVIAWGLPDVMYTIAIKEIPLVKALIFGLFDPVLTAIWPLIFLHEVPSSAAIVGAALICTAIVTQGIGGFVVFTRSHKPVIQTTT